MGQLLEAVEGRQFMAHANSILESEQLNARGQDVAQDEKEALKDRLRSL